MDLVLCSRGTKNEENNESELDMPKGRKGVQKDRRTTQKGSERSLSKEDAEMTKQE